MPATHSPCSFLSCARCGTVAHQGCKGCVLVVASSLPIPLLNCLLIVTSVATPVRGRTDHSTKTNAAHHFLKKTWEPDWVLEERVPTFVNDRPIMNFRGKKYYWVNKSVLDILQLTANEGVSYGHGLRLLFAGKVAKTTSGPPSASINRVRLTCSAASGEMRDVVETIHGLPPQYKHPVTIHMDDRDFGIVARNLITTLLAFVAPAEPQVVDCMLYI